MGAEYLAPILSVKTVQDVQEAVRHIQQYGTNHSEAILTENAEHAAYFQTAVDAAAVYHNASTRFTDGFDIRIRSRNRHQHAKASRERADGASGVNIYKNHHQRKRTNPCIIF